jgi:hypothetical protein
MIVLRDDQIEAVNKLRNGNILRGNVGSGKSLVSLAYYYKVNGGSIINGMMTSRLKDPMDLVIITTAKKRDLHEWDTELRGSIHMSEFREGNLYSNNVTIDSWNNIGKYVDVKNSFFIFDEQRLVGSGAWVKSFYKIARNNQWILLSATPGDKWEDYVPVFIANGFYRNKTEFKNEHMIFDYHVHYPKVLGYLGEKKLRRLRDQILVNMEYNNYTVQHHETIVVPYDRDLYRQVIRTRVSPFATMKIFKNVIPKPIENASEFCSILRRITNSSRERMDTVNKICASFDRVIIFYNFDFELEALRKNDWGDKEFAEYNGHKHENCPTGDKWVYVVQYNAGNEAWNCITTNCMIFYSENYSYRIMTQAAGRIDRSNTRYVDLYYWHIRTTSNIDIQIMKALNNKKQFNESAYYRRLIKNDSIKKGLAA